MSQSYEMMYIMRPDLLDEQVQQQINKYRDFLSEHKAEEIQIKNLGKRRLAYPIKKYTDGFYVQMNYKGDGKQVAPIERAMRLSDEVIRYLTIKLRDEQVAAIAPTDAIEPAESPKLVETKPMAPSPKPPVEEIPEADEISAEE
ncbi:30S ribosomal protein S6 [Gloeothece verrucosa]|uniref:Small ribosomal subunit protein bS6 n=1 Tax=Gloeothece verrucosa (strain PCC 7822) TaxID=497965 RepID=E0UJV4_GLOV7|nr:30S ribosomal protein S6 [Gloeothece verrucosa]ADN13465.1 ribosomal protein S6 [Gloeothece verrucosa PCC 7822]